MYSSESGTLPPGSLALKANLRQTAVARVEVDPRHAVLLTVVDGYAGITTALDKLLRELNHPFRNWVLILPELRGFVLKNWARFHKHERGPESLVLFAELLLQATRETEKEPLLREALGGLTAVLDKVSSQLEPAQLAVYGPGFNSIFKMLLELPDSRLFLLTQSHHPIRRTAQRLFQIVGRLDTGQPLPLDMGVLRSLRIRALGSTYDYWLQQENPESYLEAGDAVLATISHQALLGFKDQLNELGSQELPTEPAAAVAAMQPLMELPSFLDMVRSYRMAANRPGQVVQGDVAAETLMENNKLRFLFHIMEIEGLALIHEETLREINRSLVHLVQIQSSFGEIKGVFLRTFAFLKANVVRFPHTALQCVDVLGTEIFKRQDSGLVEAFLGETVRFGFQYSNVTGVGEDWAPIANPAHLYNVRVWLNLILQHPKWCSTLLSALIINLHLTGICIKDTDLFQKDVTRILNSDVEPIFNLVKQLARLLPVYFNEIGAEGELRDASTELDELSRRNDRLIHFLRKQCHVESTNLTVNLVGAIVNYWRTGDKNPLRPYLPATLVEELPTSGFWFDGVHRVVTAVFDKRGFTDASQLVDWPLDEALQEIMKVAEVEEDSRRRVFLMVQVFQLLNLKYNMGFQGLQDTLHNAARQGFEHMDRILHDMESEAPNLTLLESVLDAMESLLRVILSEERFEIREEIYQKRHIAVGIPSVYGRYQERKFDALSLTFRLENLANVCMEKLVDEIPDRFITLANFHQIAHHLNLFLRALALDGITSRKLRNHLDILSHSLQTKQFTFYQYLDLFHGFSEGVKSVINTHYASHHRDNLAVIVPQVSPDILLPKYAHLRDDDLASSLERISESFFRDLIAETFGLQSMDRYLTRVVKVMEAQQEGLSPEGLDQLMTYDPNRLFCDLHGASAESRNLVLLGNKGFNLVQLVDLETPVPPGTILTTEYFRCRNIIHHYKPAWENFMVQLNERIARIEEQTGKVFGWADDPLLLSVRSGALISMPGMMQTIHNVGINEKIVAGLIRRSGNAYFAWDNYRRFIQSWTTSFDVDRSLFSELMKQHKAKYGVRKKAELTDGQMKELALAYRAAAEASGVKIPNDPQEQLLESARQVINSWNSPKAKEYRHIMGIANDWGTAVVIQAMIFGNVHQKSGTGVLFTAHPYQRLNRVMLWGDYTPGNQGEDIVGGLVATMPISVEQADFDGRDPRASLELCFPEIYEGLLAAAKRLVYDYRYSPQEIEFTFDGPQRDNLMLLQTRDMVTSVDTPAVVHRFKVDATDPEFRLGQGLGVSGSTLCGLAVFNLDQIERLRRGHGNTPLILIRYDTVPDDIKEVSLTEGLLTARGGQTSHASIVAARLKKTCVVGCEALEVRGDAESGILGGREIHCGDKISIDGRRGLVLAGWHDVESTVASSTGFG